MPGPTLATTTWLYVYPQGVSDAVIAKAITPSDFATGKNPSIIGMISSGKGKRLGQCIPWLPRVEIVTDGVVSMRYHSGNRHLLRWGRIIPLNDFCGRGQGALGSKNRASRWTAKVRLANNGYVKCRVRES